jgi:hypothetical protein
MTPAVIFAVDMLPASAPVAKVMPVTAIDVGEADAADAAGNNE